MLKPGDVVEVRSAAEILETLDTDGALNGMPFMPEMTRFAGKRFTVDRRAEKICDTVSGEPPNSRRLRDSVLLEDLRCDGSGHDGCQAGCRIYWKEAWLRRVDSAEPATTADAGGDGLDKLEQLASAGTRTVREDGTPVYRCQATEALRASERMSNWDLAQYVRELRAGNAGPLRLLRVSVRAVAAVLVRGLHLPGIRRRILSLAGHRSRNEPGAGAERPAQPKLDLRPGDTVEVRSREEIVATLDARGKTRGLWFDPEMVPYCGRQYRVQERVEQIIDERTGEMIRIPSDCLILKGVVCSGDHSPGRWLCPREIYPYWREAWLRRVEDG